MCFVLCPTEKLLDKKIAPTLSTRMIIGSSTSMPIVSNNCLVNRISFATSEIAKYSASVDDCVTLLPNFDFVAIGAPHQ